MDSIEQTLVATQNLLCALEQDNSLLKDQRFMAKIAYLRSKHKETTDYLLKRTQHPPRDQLAGATYHRSPGCTHYWSDLPHLTYNSTAHDWCHVDVPSHSKEVETAPRPSGSGVGRRSVTQDAAEVIRNLRGYRRILRHHQLEQQHPGSAESPSTHKPWLHSFRPVRERTFSANVAKSSPKRSSPQRERQSEVVEEDDILSKSRTNSNSDVHIRRNSQETTTRRLLHKKSSSVQDLRSPSNSKPKPPFNPRPSSNVTVPKPFAFMQRRYKGNTYARKFLEKMLDDKEKEQREKLAEEEQRIKPFKAHPVPVTTYKSDNPHVESKKYADSIRKKLQANLTLQETLIRSKSMGDVTITQVKPVPATTYISPHLHSYRRARDSNKRAVQLLAEAQTPPGLKEHSVRTNIAFHLRHQHCRDSPNEKKVRRQSVPDFRRLHNEFNEKLQRVYSSKPPTVPVPFHLSQNSKKHKQLSSASPPRAHSRRPSPSLDPVFPVHETHSSLLRTEAIRKKLDTQIAQKERQQHVEAEHEAEVELQRSRIKRSMSRGKEQDIEKKVEERRRAMLETGKDYEEQLREMRRRVMSRPLVMEQQSTSAQQNAMERKFKQALSGVSGVSKSMTDLNKNEQATSSTVNVPKGRRLSATSGGTYSVKSKQSSNNSEKDEYKLDFESGSSSTPSSSGKASVSSLQSRRSSAKSSSSS